ncbi:MAG TPA: winged helix DNA-binding domain-containing protein [Solirubrobacterales bacterium]|nr:winged helix DNA-binding domain-containing protein [Solirubrobacterales bacterium]
MAIAGAQAQDKRAGLLHFRARARGLTADAVERARVETRSLVRGWLMRGTVHLVASEDYGWMRPLFAAATVRQSRRRLAQLGLDAGDQDRAIAIIRRALGTDGLLTRNALVERLGRAGIAVPAETRVHLIRVVVSEGAACIGPDEGASGTLVATADWLGEAPAPDRDAALADLARRYLGAFGPASDRDLAKWSGLGLRDCRRGLDRIAGELAEVGDGGRLLALRRARPRAPPSPLVRLLPAFDTYLMGYSERVHAVDADGERRVLPGGGILRPTICLDGRLVGLWSSKRSGRRLEISIEPFAPLTDPVLAAIEREAADVGRFEGAPAALTAS